MSTLTVTLKVLSLVMLATMALGDPVLGKDPRYGDFIPIRDGHLDGVEYAVYVTPSGSGPVLHWMLRNTYIQPVSVKITFTTAEGRAPGPCYATLADGEEQTDGGWFTYASAFTDAVAKVERAEIADLKGTRLRIWPSDGQPPVTIVPGVTGDRTGTKEAPPGRNRDQAADAKGRAAGTVQIWIRGRNAPIEFIVPTTPLNSEVRFGDQKSTGTNANLRVAPRLDAGTRTSLDAALQKIEALLNDPQFASSKKDLLEAQKSIKRYLGE